MRKGRRGAASGIEQIRQDDDGDASSRSTGRDGDLGRTEAVVTRNSHFPIRFIDKKKKQMRKGTAYCKVHRYKVCVEEETERWIER